MWLHVPASCRASAASADSTSPSDSFFQTLASSCTSRGKHPQWRSLRRAWGTGFWTRLRCGPTCEPSPTWFALIGSSADSPARTSVPQGSGLGSKASGRACSTRWSMLPIRWERASSSWRTWQQSLLEDSTPYSGAWPKAGGMRSGCVYARPAWEPRTEGTDGSASRGEWATATAHERTHTPRDVDHGEQLANQVDQWQTPATFLGKYRRQVGQTERAEELLPAQAENWPTSAFSPPAPPTRDGPTSSSGGPTSRPLWRSPQVADEKNVGPKEASGNRVASNGAACQVMLRSQVLGGQSNVDAKRRLNPAFVEWLMGLPIGWTDFAPVETASYLSRLRSHYESFCEGRGGSTDAA